MTCPIKATRYWLEHIVIGQNFCPFAQKPFAQEQINYTVINADDNEHIGERFLAKCEAMHDNADIETSLVILHDNALTFEQYLDIVDECQWLLERHDYVGQFQIASFHPQYVFAGEETDSPSHYTNRAPFPILHILREHSLSQVLDNMPNAHTIPQDNVERALALGEAFFAQHLAKAHAQN